jgi:hypothetical protein
MSELQAFSGTEHPCWLCCVLAAVTGERMQWSLRDVMKPTERTFKTKTRNYAVWVQRIKARRAEQRAALKAARLQQQQSDAAEIRAAILADDDGQQQQQTLSGPQ